VESGVIEYFYVYKSTSANQVACAALKQHQTVIFGRHSMHLATPSTVARRVCRGDKWMSFGRGVFPPSFPFSSSRKLHVLTISKK
jgi:hypothetical protein